MAKIHIASVDNNETTYSVLIALTETQTIEGEDMEVPIGEATITFPHKTETADVKGKIVDAAQAIFKAHQNALDKKKDLEELELPDIQ